MKKTENLISDSTLVNVDELPINTLSNEAVEKKVKDATKQEKKMRYIVVRVSRENIATKDNEKIGIKAGDVVTYTENDIEDILLKWLRRRKKMKYYFITHDEDPNNIHYHIVLDFDGSSECTFSVVKNLFPYGYIEPVRYGVRASVQYLVHMNHPQKFQYSWDKVKTNAPAKLESHKKATAYNMDIRAKWVIDQIIAGNLKEFEIEKIEPDIYIKYATKIKHAFDYRKKLVMQDLDRDIQVIAVQGPPRVGKSLMLKTYAKAHNMSICFSSASNDVWDSYGGQDIFVYDDFDYHKISITDFTKELDFHNNTSVKRRYHNAVFQGSIVFICTNIPIIEWFKEEDETLRAPIFKRIKRVIDFQDYKLRLPITIDEIEDTQEHIKACAEFDKRFELDNGVARYTVNEIKNLEDIDSAFREYVCRNFSRNANRFLLSVDKGELMGNTTYYYFDLKKYVDLTSDENKTQDIVDELTCL